MIKYTDRNDIKVAFAEEIRALAAQIAKATDEDLINWAESYPRSANSAREKINTLLNIVAKAA